jgi:predicted nucleotide-binding protein (sugar kinase/HSP70/actin superfamily)
LAELASTAPLLVMPALAPQHLAAVGELVAEAGYRLKVLPALCTRDVEAGLRFCDNDLCHPLIAVAGQVIETVRAYEGAESLTVALPQICCGCRAIELEHIVRGHLNSTMIDSPVEIVGIPSRNALLTMPAQFAARVYEAFAAVDTDASGVGERHTGLPPVGVVGTAGLLYTPQLNRDILDRVKAEGCTPHTLPFVKLLTTNAPLEHAADHFVEQGILDIVCVQSFGCLNGHIHGRGAAKRLKRRHPTLNISFIDYDAGASGVNQDNRLKLACTIARERFLKVGQPESG